MPKYSDKSKERLSTCHKDLQTIFNEVIKNYDCTIVCGARSIEEQQRLYAQGRTTPGDVVTHVDGIEKRSKHNYTPSTAVDAVPYPSLYGDLDALERFAGYVMGVANTLYSVGAIANRIRSGGDWDRDNDTKDQRFIDLPHFELI